MCGLNLTHQLRTDDSHVAELRQMSSAAASFAADLFEFMHERMASLSGSRTFPLHDPCAVLAVTAPHLLEFEDRAVAVELHGTLTRGMTVVDERVTRKRDPANVADAYRIDASAALRHIMEVLAE